MRLSLISVKIFVLHQTFRECEHQVVISASLEKTSRRSDWINLVVVANSQGDPSPSDLSLTVAGN